MAKMADQLNLRSGKVVATVLSGNSEDIIAAAVASVVNFVDEVLLIDTGISDQTTSAVHTIAKGKYYLCPFPWCRDFAAARNAALEFASQRGATWALTVDTDERLDLTYYVNRDGLLKQLDSNPDVKTWLVSAKDGSYTKERFIRLPTQYKWSGRTHEALNGALEKERGRLRNCWFWETPKSPIAFQSKLERDFSILMEETEANPINGRWWYYLGQTLELLGRNDEALTAFRKCIEVEEWGEQAAWASYCASKCLIRNLHFEEARATSAVGLTRDIAFPELAWVVAWCSYQLSDYRQAIEWSRIAASLGSYNGSGLCERRVGLRFLPAWYELPFDVIRYAGRCLGRIDDVAEAEADFWNAKGKRECK